MHHKPIVPKILKTPLVFGDIKQIEALRSYEHQHKAYYGDGEPKQFIVYIDVDGSTEVVVGAMSAKEAEDKAERAFDHQFDITFTAEEFKQGE